MTYREAEFWKLKNVPISLHKEFDKKIRAIDRLHYSSLFTMRRLLMDVKREVNYNEESPDNRFMKSNKSEGIGLLVINGQFTDLYDSPERIRNKQYLEHFKKKFYE